MLIHGIYISGYSYSGGASRQKMVLLERSVSCLHNKRGRVLVDWSEIIVLYGRVVKIERLDLQTGQWVDLLN